MGLQEFFNWQTQARTQTTNTIPAVADEDLVSDVDEPPDHIREKEHERHDFHKFALRPQSDLKVSLLTVALKHPEIEPRPVVHVATDLARRRSGMSNASLASTAELTSDGGLTSPARTNTPSPPFPNAAYTSFAPFSLGKPKSMDVPAVQAADATKESISELPQTISVSPKAKVPAEVVPKKRCISFQCIGKDVAVTRPAPVVAQPAATVVPTTDAPKRRCIKFMCPGPKFSEKSIKVETPASKVPQPSKVTETLRRNNSRSPSLTRKSPRPAPPATSRSHRDSTGTVRRTSQSPLAHRTRPKYIIADETTLQSSEATRFHEFASAELQEDDWIRTESVNPKGKLTINDTLRKENAIRQLGNEAEQEALEDDENEEEEDIGNDSDDENDNEDEDEDEDEDEEVLTDGSDEDASDGNETDNEAGFAESDDESDGEGDFSFWTPGRNMHRQTRNAITHKSSSHRTASASSLESFDQLKKIEDEIRRPRRRAIKIRPGTPDLPDSTDFVCGTLDEDRPLEDAYVSCMEARKYAKHKRTPQDIDPSFPTSDPEDEEDEHDILPPNDSGEEHVWLHGKFEDSDSERPSRRRSTTSRRKSPAPSPRRLRSPPPSTRRLHSPPPPPKTRLRSPPPRKLFGHSPRRTRSPQPSRVIPSPRGSPTAIPSAPIGFAPLGSRPGLTHTKSLPRTPNAFCRQYHADRLVAANGTTAAENGDGHKRGAIDIVKGLEHKRQRRKEKFFKKHHKVEHKTDRERKPLPGKGAERMEQLGLLLSGKSGPNRGAFMMSA
jgi:hypothetical protein